MGLRRQVGVGILVQLVILLVGFWRVYSVYFHLVVGLGKKRLETGVIILLQRTFIPIFSRISCESPVTC